MICRRYVTACRRHELRPLLASMRRHCGRFSLDVLAWDWDPPGWSPDEPGVHYTRREAFLDRNPKSWYQPGSVGEVACAVRWAFAADVMWFKGDPVTVIDGDQWFWSSPEPVYDEIGDARAALSPHGFAPAAVGLPGVTLESHGKYGRFNGGWSYWADIEAARWMAAANRRWSYGRIEHFEGRERYGDQSWLEEVHERFGAHVVRNWGLNVGPWNVHRWWAMDPRPELISYHYSSFRPDGQAANAEYAVTPEQERLIYEPYRRAVAGNV